MDMNKKESTSKAPNDNQESTNNYSQNTNYNSITTPREFIAIPIITNACRCNQIHRRPYISLIQQEQNKQCLCIICGTIIGFSVIIILHMIAGMTAINK